MLWCAQVDAAAKVEAEVDGGGGNVQESGKRKRSGRPQLRAMGT